MFLIHPVLGVIGVVGAFLMFSFALVNEWASRRPQDEAQENNVQSMQMVDLATRNAEAVEAMGSVDILVNNAGITRDNLFTRMKDDEWQDVIDVNLTSTMRLMKSVMRPMMKARWGRIINISSIVGATGNPGQANYAASKAGMVGMTKSIAYEVASRGITANAIAPGFFPSNMTKQIVENEEMTKAALAQIPRGRAGKPEDIAGTALYLCSEASSWLIGQTIPLDGGMISKA